MARRDVTEWVPNQYLNRQRRQMDFEQESLDSDTNFVRYLIKTLSVIFTPRSIA